MERLIIYEIALGAYLIFLMLSFFILKILRRELKEKMQYLIDKKWKRVLWLGSCFLFVPFLIGIMRLSFVIFEETRDFIDGKDI